MSFEFIILVIVIYLGFVVLDFGFNFVHYAIKMLKNQTKIRHTPDFSFKEIDFQWGKL